MNSPSGRATGDDAGARTAWTTTAPAKINLDLRMRGRRADGYHLLSTLFHSIALADTLTLTPSDGPFRLVCDTPGVPTDASNLAWRGAAAMASALGVPLDGWTLTLEKVVPAESGLGGGSADAVAAARLVAAAAGMDVDPDRLAAIVGGLGADVAFFVRGGAALGEGIGNELTMQPDARDAEVLIVRPPFGVSTRDAYAWFDGDTAGRAPEAAAGGEPAWRNDLEAPVVARRPAIGAIVARLAAAGATYAAMSGSGSACFGLFVPGTEPSAWPAGWPEGTRTWQTRLLSRAAYGAATACRQAVSSVPRPTSPVRSSPS